MMHYGPSKTVLPLALIAHAHAFTSIYLSKQDSSLQTFCQAVIECEPGHGRAWVRQWPFCPNQQVENAQLRSSIFAFVLGAEPDALLSVHGAVNGKGTGTE